MYTMEEEDQDKVLNFLDVRMKNDQTGKYEFGVHRKDAVINVQVKNTPVMIPTYKQGLLRGL